MSRIYDSKYLITPRVIVNNMQANGAEMNVIEFTFTDSSSYDPAAGLTVVISVDSASSAVIKESSSAYYKTDTNTYGKVTASITDTIAESATITAFVFSSQSEKAQATVIFKEVSDHFYISRASSTNKTFTAEQPKTAWNGASFTLYTEGGSGQIDWTVSGATAEVIVEGDDLERTANVTILSKMEQPCIITATDSVSGEADTYVFNIENFIQPEATEKVGFNTAKGTHPNSLMNLTQYQQLFDEWGDMSAYASQGWSTDDVYWTSNEEILGYVTVFNLQYGIDSNVQQLGVSHYYSFIVG